ncbi:DUF3311 domain-containing protein [Halapricum hydrolyticum]|uniref:DUF3311 domain-containing protein n=1 Tax=Halapricum hydrolyticum TaxID=2979991 RepID=A0AAE3I9E5_9EURY|nr:DUF3311 domain-containing protein [Halapricum hydrolyticum]MCU4716643.1 DUF3311 domain-containing protein [Halapricum hydrolyticum]MCU4725752.1 DUF3311 domain-containing protein [Halapricum hydrolyticum]
MTERVQIILWGAIGFVLIGLAVPWFMWRSDAVVAGLPIWIWWHIGWLALASVVFYVFAQRAWGLGVERGGHRG